MARGKSALTPSKWRSVQAASLLSMPTVTRMANHKDVSTIKPTTKARGGVTGHNVRYVLAFGLAGVIIAFLIIGLYFYGVQF